MEIICGKAEGVSRVTSWGLMTEKQIAWVSLAHRLLFENNRQNVNKGGSSQIPEYEQAASASSAGVSNLHGPL